MFSATWHSDSVELSDWLDYGLYTGNVPQKSCLHHDNSELWYIAMAAWLKNERKVIDKWDSDTDVNTLKPEQNGAILQTFHENVSISI